MFDKSLLTPDYKDFDAWTLRAAQNSSGRAVDRWALARAKQLQKPMNARQYFNSQLADAMIVASSVTPSTTQTSVFTPYTLCQTSFPLGYGLAAPFAGQVYEFAMGGIVTTPATGTLVITPFYGAGSSTTSWTNAVSLGASAAQTVTASLSSQPWWISGALVFRSISSAVTSSTCWLSGNFASQGTLATAGGGWSVVFGSTAAVSVDTTGTAANGLQSYGSITFSVTFSVTGATIITEWTSWKSLN